jgi:hypothetical protein
MFHKITRVEIEPAYSVDIVNYVCDAPGCTNEVDDPDLAEVHYLNFHAFSPDRKTYVDGHRTLYFESSELLDLYKKHEQSVDVNDTVYMPATKEAGWYIMQSGEGPCSRGCCTRSWTKMISLNSYEETLKSKLKETISEVRKLRELRKRP